ncbi:condensation domain-containing protein [Streptosporangium carneum]|uniref:condensation domain-containing protein n=1 Tax=Streptosporangium carneum TaxID=47481 RepID=UPI0022F3034E|nr:condensation domain-containing protein [Streptosporangium carneum]
MLHLNGPLDVPALLRACAAVAERHPVLGPVRVARVESSPERYPGVAAAEVARPFDLENGPLARFTLVRVGRDRNRLIFTAHGRVFDGCSKDVLVHDLADAYFSRAAPPGPAVPYGERGTAAEAAEADSTAARTFWRDRGHAPQGLVLPGLRATAHGVGPGEIVEMVLAGAEFQAFAAAATTLGATRFELLVAAVGVLLRRYGNTGSPLALALGTRTDHTRDHIGPFVAEMPFAACPSLDETLPVYLRAVRSELRELYRHRHAPPETVLRPVLLGYRRRAAAPYFPGVGTGVEWTVFNGAARGVLHLEAVDGDMSLTLGLRFNPLAIGHDDVARVAGHLRALLRAIAAEPRAKVADLAAPVHPEPDEEPPVTELFSPAENAASPSSEQEDEVVAQVRQIWQEVLRLDDIGLDEDLYDLGGHSLTITQIIARARRRLGVEVSLDVFFDTPTIAGMAEEVSRLRGDNA